MNQNNQGHSLPIEFTASGSEYFRIWIVNLLLIVVTLGFYLPFAKARRLRYFYANTAVDGHALAFHGDPWKMLRGYVLMLLLFGAYAASGHVSAWASLAVFVLLAVLWPALWRSSLRFRLGNTSWRGLRFGFEGGLGPAYAGMGLLFVPGLLAVLGTALALDGVDQGDAEAVKAAMNATLPWTGAALLVSLVLVPVGFWRVKRYQQAGYRYAQQRSEFSASLGSFFGLGLKLLGYLLLGGFCLGLTGVLGTLMLSPWLKALGAVGPLIAAGLFVLGYLVLLSLLGAFGAARLQNLVWVHTRSQQLRVNSELEALPLARLMLKNLVLTVLTLGLYRPFAVVSQQRMRLDAVTLNFDESPEQWRAGFGPDPTHASGEMAGDFFGIDLGL